MLLSDWPVSQPFVQACDFLKVSKIYLETGQAVPYVRLHYIEN